MVRRIERVDGGIDAENSNRDADRRRAARGAPTRGRGRRRRGCARGPRTARRWAGSPRGAAGGGIFFPPARHKSWFDGHSFASGLFPFADGKSQESSSEAANCYYGAYLWARVRWDGDGTAIVDLDTGVDAGHPDYDYLEPWTGEKTLYSAKYGPSGWVETRNSDTSSGHGTHAVSYTHLTLPTKA